MAWTRFWLSLIAAVFIHGVYVLCVDGKDCKIGDYDFSPLDLSYPWMSVSPSNDTYWISICSAVNHDKCPTGSSICREKSGSFISVGNYTSSPPSHENKDKEIVVSFTGGVCPSNSSASLRTDILFKCGKTLGSPNFLSQDNSCTEVFEWESLVACKKRTETVKEVPCYVYVKGKKRDLTPLVKLKGAYKLVSESDGSPDFVVNICRAITKDPADPSLSNCPEGSASCGKILENLVGLGQPTTALRAIDERTLQLVYKSETSASSCTGTPQTVITFICPTNGQVSNSPIVSQSDCLFKVDWITQYACEESEISVKNSLQLIREKDDIDFDLTPLSKKNYIVDATEKDGTKYKISLAIGHTIGCFGSVEDDRYHPSVCQRKPDNDEFARVLGSNQHSVLRYNDRHLTLTYKEGQKCSSNLKRKTIIEFHCNKSAVNSKPVYRFEEYCSYYFDWYTPYACIDHPLQEKCNTVNNGKLFDLSSLRYTSDNNWVALNGHEYNDDAEILLNVCHDIMPSGRAVKCPTDSAICLKKFDGTTKSLGRYQHEPVYNDVTKTLQLNYTDGDKCSSGKIFSVITFFCSPGMSDNAPVVVTKSSDDCAYYLEWHTAAACVVTKKKGANCQLENKIAGISFNLTPLRKLNGFYKLHMDKYTYFINVCDNVKTGTCKLNTPAGVCQTEDETKVSKNAGHANSILTYEDGILKLIYENGDKYNSDPPVARRSVITFVCNTKASLGRPEFIKESNSTYWFLWYTKFACVTHPVECTFTDEQTHEQYDLSSLTKMPDNWVITQIHTHPVQKYYINVCRSLNHVPVETGCDVLSAVCSTKVEDGKEVIANENLGEVVKGLQKKGDNIVLEYTNGKACMDTDHKLTNYSTTIHFHCTKKISEHGPSLLNINSGCHYVFLWNTPAACIQTSTESNKEKCSVKDTNSGYIYNLQPLTRDGSYSIVSQSRKFYLNICGPVNLPGCTMPDNSKAAVCEQVSGTVTGLAAVNTELELTDRHLQLVYAGKHLSDGSLFKVTINFVCAKETDLGIVSLVRTTESSYIFQFDTPLACPPQTVDCVVQDRLGNQYDLSRLTKQNGNWELPVGSMKYIINICSPINDYTGNTSCAGNVGGCQIAPGRGDYNMGYVQGKPIALSDGTLSLRYRNGDLCHKGTDKESHRSTRINFFCSPVEHYISFESETKFCEYIFTWRTPAACPIKRITGKSCKVVDPLYKNEFDLNLLRKSTGNYHVIGGGYDFLLNVCGTLNTEKTECNKDTGSAACQTRSSDPSFAINIGKTSDELVYEDGIIFLTYKDGKSNCHKKFNRKTIIIFTCDPNVEGTTGPHFIEEKDDCSYLFEWPTRHVCPKITTSNCKIQDSKGNEYDFSGLRLSSNNYIYLSPGQDKQKFILNVCQTLVHRKGETCPSSSAACRIYLNETDSTKKYHNIGELGSNPLEFFGNFPRLVYKNGEPCGEGKTSSTYITFQCDLSAVDSSPKEYYYIESKCEHHFLWVAREACPLNQIPSHNDTCSVTDESTGVSFDLSQLKKSKGYTISDQKEHSFQLNICGAVANSQCSKESSSCQTNTNTNKSFNCGKANSNLQFKEGVIFLNYSGGDKCHGGKFERNTIINFVCNPSKGIGAPVYLAESKNCTYYFSWHTDLVCEKQFRCTVIKGGQMFDLSPLVQMSGHHVAEGMAPSEDPGASYYINICRPLNPIYGSICPPLASVCETHVDENGVSLGSVSDVPYIDPNDQAVTIHYKNGAPCPNSKQNRSTIIKFRCKVGPSLGHPVLMDAIDSCTYIFNWETNLVCNKSAPDAPKHCVYKDTRTLIEYDFSSLHNSDVNKIPADPSGNFLLRVCGPVSGLSNNCKKSGACYVDTNNHEVNYGNASDAVFSIDRNLISLTYQNGDPCSSEPGTRASTKILFLCNNTAGLGKPVLFEKTSCQLVFIWKTKFACPPAVKDCFLSYLNSSYDLSSLANTQSWKAMTVTGETYWINVCQSLYTRPKSQNCSGSGAAVCVESKNEVMTIGSASRVVLYVDRNSPVNNPVIILQYSSDTPVCSNKRATTIIRFSCSRTMGRPVFSKKNLETCTYEFNWATYLACKEDREAMKEVNGVLIDYKSSRKIYFGNQTQGRTFRVEETRGTEKFYYDISFDGKLYPDDENEGSDTCKNAAVCQRKKGDSSYYKNLGSATKKRFYMDADYMDLEITSPEKCHSNPSKNIVSVFEFFCTRLASQENPTFVYESNECVFLFYWHSKLACPHYNNSDQSPKKQVSVASSNYHILIIVTSVTFSIIIIAVLLKILMKPEQKQIMKENIKNIFTRNRTVKARYINVPQIDDGDDEGLLVMEDEHNITYHDDSDEDMIL
ncbi:cation-independent mannose-6-phosphate receptor isoform X1 [Octopus sinensis]|uniref:Cation-independent mannose-6-phosphate receptor isoform X1 n=1 Tax=Octopus sinensis TaxID=2607531 RepID=A0A7E6F4H0_9MOLL|nr:cation-independent mannose-6-phosphate receptor isoform X1 [Octopus sinensis]